MFVTAVRAFVIANLIDVSTGSRECAGHRVPVTASMLEASFVHLVERKRIAFIHGLATQSSEPPSSEAQRSEHLENGLARINTLPPVSPPGSTHQCVGARASGGARASELK